MIERKSKSGQGAYMQVMYDNPGPPDFQALYILPNLLQKLVK